MRLLLLVRNRRRLVLFLLVYGLAFGIRIGFIVYQRSRPAVSKKQTLPVNEQDYMVSVPSFGVRDLQDVRRLQGKTLWVKAGFQADYFPLSSTCMCRATVQRNYFRPFEKIKVLRVSECSSLTHSREVQLIFEREGIEYATVAGFADFQSNEYHFQLDDLFFPQDPHVLYSHWTEETWKALESHQLKKGMTFVQVPLSLGNGFLIGIRADGSHLYRFLRHPGGSTGLTQVRFFKGQVIDYQLLD